MPKISVCIATYNGEKYIRTQLESILKQLSDNSEIIISDDGSNDSTLLIIESFYDPRIKLFPYQTFKSPIYNFENALKHATGDVIFLSDQDDLWLDGKVEKMMAAIKTHDVVLSDCRIVDAKDQTVAESFFEVNGSGRGLLKNLYRNSYLGCCLAFKRKVFERILPFPSDIPMHDWWIGIIAEAYYKIAIINEPLIHYRRHGINASPTGEASQYSYYKRLIFRLTLLKGLWKTWLRG